MTNPAVDWSQSDKYPEDTVTCSCDVSFRSHVKATFDGGRPTITSRKPCPGCGAMSGHRRASSDPELMTIGGF